MEKKIKTGDVVVLKSGGPSMTVETIDESSCHPSAKCLWFDGPERKDSVFALDVLMLDNFEND